LNFLISIFGLLQICEIGLLFFNMLPLLLSQKPGSKDTLFLTEQIVL